ncbi:hypothetical protein GCM10010873_28790 [Cypionkella aquatica]|uniref:Uncharacterized protein n=1 Tax=Cypionkella aquatica TaxID=1756042 RepID=A0AA37X340_9RHOB|nr:hypothetical protein [Cypionkella aquatica]GLS87905.1 hypothetical protein GCM10010873_28790 [Cypionkella aquatica]
MPSLSPTDELSEIRATLARLKTREASLCAALHLAAQHPTAPAPRPGWPIQRAGTELH